MTKNEFTRPRLVSVPHLGNTSDNIIAFFSFLFCGFWFLPKYIYAVFLISVRFHQYFL
ncbi:unnamed protein product [Nezara viridula]|uniref:Uncharacterized protein n=1 Tax=Nezara viridula TaxID=85310 RepID=A0A9P0E6B5_NEZVI|nr:unnamed protein product [Nezara viridula]